MFSLPHGPLETAVVDPQTEWTRRRLQALLGGGAVVVLALLAGGVWSMVHLVAGGSGIDDRADGADQADMATLTAQDRVATRPFADLPPEAARPGELSSDTTGTMRIPAPASIGEVGVASGFPKTAEGALAQLAAIDSTALGSASVRVAQEVIGQWAAPGGPTAESWTGVHAVAALLQSAGMSADAQEAITITVEPKMGLIKGAVGSDFVVPCVDFLITAALPAGSPQRVAAADCQRMVWHDDRWVVGPGSEPAPAPSVWPGSQVSFDAGYQWLEVPQS